MKKVFANVSNCAGSLLCIANSRLAIPSEEGVKRRRGVIGNRLLFHRSIDVFIRRKHTIGIIRSQIYIVLSFSILETGFQYLAAELSLNRSEVSCRRRRTA